MDSILWDKLDATHWERIQSQMVEDGIDYFQKIGIELTKEDFKF
ncbi:hypothetical protein JCM19236_616 [Vibrio sp. JCM 19236]|nr:hypothetical protein JCM19236_616 [Vibrio sp. JCM 19236]